MAPMKKNWMNYSVSALQHCTALFAKDKNILVYFKEMTRKCIERKFYQKGMKCETRYGFSCQPVNKDVYRESPEFEVEGQHSVFHAMYNPWLYQMNTTVSQPLEQQCISVTYYRSRFHRNPKAFVLINSHPFIAQFHVLKYSFNVLKIFRLKFTFKVFELTDMCTPVVKPRMYGSLWAHFLLTEFVRLRGKHYQDGIPFFSTIFFYCMKRPQWSVFTSKTTALEYSLCRVCVGLTSRVTFIYQVIDRFVLWTTEDTYRMAAYGKAKVSMYETSFVTASQKVALNPMHICVGFHPRLRSCDRYVSNVFLKHEKFMFLRFRKMLGTKMRIFFLDYLNHEKYVFEFLEMEDYYIKSFHCTVQAIRQWDDANFVRYQFIEAKVIQRDIHSDIVKLNYFSDICSNIFHCQVVYRLQGNPSTYLQADVTRVVFTGWRMVSCMYGGVSFHEYNKSAQSYIEVNSICRNSSDLRSSGQAQKFSAMYTSTSNKVLITFYHFPQDLLNISLAFLPSTCQGVFVNPCFDITFPSEHQGVPLHHPQLVTDPNLCRVVQFGFFILYSGGLYNGRVIKNGCVNVFEMKPSDISSWCGSSLKYVQVSWIPSYTVTLFNELDDTYKGDTFLFSSKVRTEQKLIERKDFPCEEKLNNMTFFRKPRDKIMKGSQWHRGLNIFNTHISGMNASFEATMSLIYFQRKMYDSFATTVGPLSDSLSILELHFISCEISSLLTLPTGIGSLSSTQRRLCLREPVKGVMVKNSMLELSLSGKLNCFHCSIGNISFMSNLCLSLSWAKVLYKITTYHPSPEFNLCVPNKQNLGEDKLIWKSNVPFQMFYLSNMFLLVDLPGKILDVKFNSTPNICDSDGDCWLKYRWLSREEPPVEYAKSYYRYMSVHIGTAKENDFSYQINLFKIFSRDIKGDYEEPSFQTWYEADRMCNEKGGILPQIVSVHQIYHLTVFVKRAAVTVLLTNVFIGIISEVQETYLSSCGFICKCNSSSDTLCLKKIPNKFMWGRGEDRMLCWDGYWHL